MKRILKLVSGAACVFVLAGCQTTQGAAGTQASRIDSALERAAGSGTEQASLPYLEKIYKRNSEDAEAAVNYAAALRKEDYLNEAAAVLGPFADVKEGNAAAKREYAAVQLAMGNNERAEKYAQKAVIANDADAQAYHYLGIALEAQGKHPEAERAFRKALEHWEGDPVPIMNNLALNLAAQGYLDEALEIMHKAKAMAPDRLEVERNLRIVTALQQSYTYQAPAPSPKPGI